MNRFVKIGSIVFICGIIMASMSEAKTHQANVSNSIALRNNNSSGSSKGTTHSNSNTTKRSTNSSSTKTTSNNKNNSSSKGTTHSNSNTTKRSTNSSSTKTTSNNKNNSSSKGTTRPSSNTTKQSTNSSPTKTTSNKKNNSSNNKGTSRPSSNTTKQPTNSSSTKPTSNKKNKNNAGNNGNTRPSDNVTNQPVNGNNGNPAPQPANGTPNKNNDKKPSGNPGIKWESKSDRPRYKYSNLHPNRIPLKPYSHPKPPRSFRPHRGCPVISDILGLTIGMTLDLSMDYLFNKGYIIDRYGDNIVCLCDVNEFGFLWSYVILYYDEVGGLVGSQFSYSTSYYDLSRYNSLYNMLISRYGNPVSTQNTGTGLSSTWFGYDNQYISIGFTPMYAENGQLRYYTTLSFGV